MHHTRLALSLTAAVAALMFNSPAPVHAAPDFEKDVKPILEAKCLLCHGTGKEKGGLQLHTREAMLKGGDSEVGAVIPGKIDASLLIERIMLDPVDDEIMPQETDPLSEEQIEILKAWVAAGAEMPDGMRLKAQKLPIPEDQIVIPSAPPGSTDETAATIDKIIAHENGDRDLLKADQITDKAFLRRATIDLVGRIPSMEELSEFESWSPADRREKLIEKLLADSRFADRWTVFYSDMLRVRSNAAGGRELQAWIHSQVSENRPYDQMARELISASGRPGHSPAVGFILNDNADPMSMTAAVGQIFLGVRLACAQCHDHPFDDWNQMEFYEMASFFGKTIRQQSNFTRTVYTTETDEMRVQWPPERENPETREPVNPRFPFELAEYEETPHWIARFEEKRAAEEAKLAVVDDGKELENLIDIDAGPKKKESFNVLAEAKRASADLDVTKDLYRPSELRKQLAEKIANPRNNYFARAFVNRVWAELNGRGFVEPLDNFTEFQDMKHPQTLEFLSHEFIASGYDLKELIRMIMLTDTYRRGHLPADTDPNKLEAAESRFTASPVRRMLSEALYDSVVIAGHLTEKKWRSGENIRMVENQIRIPIVDEDAPEALAAPDSSGDAPQMAMNAMNGNNMASAGAGYSLENAIEIDFDKVLSDAAAQEKEIDKMRAMADAKLEQEERMRMMMEQQRRRPQRYQLKTIKEEIDDNPQFNSTLRMASPAPADHFLRVFGQPSRQGLGEFRDHSPSLRQQLMMLNGKATHEAARVGTLEPMYQLLSGDEPQIDQAIEYAYLETLTREPTAEEFADAKVIVGEAESPLDGMADLRWALLNCHEFRFMP